MQFNPSFDQSLLTLRNGSGNQFHRLDRKDRDIVLVVGVEVRTVMALGRLGKHSDDDPIETREFRHLERVSETAAQRKTTQCRRLLRCHAQSACGLGLTSSQNAAMQRRDPVGTLKIQTHLNRMVENVAFLRTDPGSCAGSCGSLVTPAPSLTSNRNAADATITLMLQLPRSEIVCDQKMFAYSAST